MIIPDKVEAALDDLVAGFVDVMLVQRFEGVCERDLAEQFSCIATFDKWGLPDDVAARLRVMAYERLHSRLIEKWAHVFPGNDTVH